MQKESMQIKMEKFSIKQSSRYAIQVTATIDEKADMLLRVDDIAFREIPADKNVQQYNIPAAWNGSILKGQSQTNVYILNLTEGEHNLSFHVKNGSANQLQYKVTKLLEQDRIEFDLDLVAKNLERQPLINFIVVNESIAQVTAQVSTCWHFDKPGRGDGDDVKLLIDAEIYTNDDRYNWMWHASPEQEDLEKIEFKTAYPMLEKGMHYIEFIADRSPKINKVIIDTQPKFEGDYLCQVAVRNKLSEVDGQLESKLVLGVYVPSGNPDEINNGNAKLYYKNKEVKVKLNSKSFPLETAFDFSGRWLEVSDKKWFYYGIDTSWTEFKVLVNDYDFMDGSNWKLVVKKD